MKFYIYSLRNHEEAAYLDAISREMGFSYEATWDYPTVENLSRAEGCEGIAVITTPVTKEYIDRLAELKIPYLATRSVGYEHIDIAYAYEKGMRVSNVNYTPDAVANYTIMLMLIACRRMPYIMKTAAVQDFSLRDGKLGRELSKMTVGIIGTGNIGATVAKHLTGFGCRLLCYDLYKKPEIEAIAEYVDLDTLYAESDLITIHVPALPENYHMIGREAIGKMKDGVILINAARGMMVDTDALIEGIESGKIDAAALDTIEHEEGLYYLDHSGKILKGHYDRAKLLSYPNVFLTPHMAYYTEQVVYEMILHACEALCAFARGEETRYEVPH